jgi:type IV pilus assembly protein PilA
MVHVRGLLPTHRHIRKLVTLFALFFVVASISPAQQAAVQAEHPESAITQELNKYPGLTVELNQLFVKLQQNVQFPAPRTDSRILTLLPQGTVAYVAIPNYGNVAAQSAKIFRQELQDSAVLRDWWTHSNFTATSGPKFLSALEQFAQIHEYLGDEIILSASMDVQEPTFLFVSEIRKPGLKAVLKQFAAQISGNPTSPMRVIDLSELAAATERPHAEEPIILVRPDFVVVSLDLKTLRAFSAQLDAPKPEFASTPFGLRVAKEYKAGATVLAAANISKIIDKTSPALKSSVTWQHSGFAEMQYLVWDHSILSGKSVSQSELSFSSPRHGAASWLAKPTTLGSLDFVSPKSPLAITMVLSNPSQIFDDAKDLAALSHSNAFASVSLLEQSLNLSLKDDLLSLLGGELTFELNSLTPPQPVWTIMLSVKDSNHIQQTLSTLLTVAQFPVDHSENGGVTYNSFQVPAAKNPTRITYALVDGYLLIGSSSDTISEAVQLHLSGTSLAKNANFLASFPQGHPLEASALLYEDPIAMGLGQMQSLMPDLANMLTQSPSKTSPVVVSVYGEDSSIRTISTNSKFDAAGLLVGAAIAMPNLLRSRIVANEASAVGSIRTVNTAQVTYAAVYPKRGYAPNLASLGPNPADPNDYSAEHAGLLDSALGNQICVKDAWCTKSGYNFKVSSVCKLQSCKDFLVVAVPVTSATGTRNFCSTSDAIIRVKPGDPLAAPLSIADCKTWPPLK